MTVMRSDCGFEPGECEHNGHQRRTVTGGRQSLAAGADDGGRADNARAVVEHH